MNIQTQQWLLPRRHFLRGLGATIALPMLDCMRPLRANPAAGAPPPRRGVFIYLPNGVNTLDYQILQAGADYQMSRSLQPLERHRDRFTPISGLYHPNGLGRHHNCWKTWLTGAKSGPTDRNSVSVDQLMAEVTAPHTRFSSLQLSNTDRSLSFNRDGIMLPPEQKPSQVFSRLFEAPEDGVEAQRRGLDRRGSILDAVLEEARSLEKRMGHEDRTRLDQYLTSVREVEVRTERAESWLDVPRPEVDPEDERRVNREVSQQKVGDYFRAIYDLIVLAFETDVTRVATFSSGSEGKGLPIPELDINQTRHALSHHNGDPDQMRRLTESDVYNLEQFAYFLDRLGRVEDEQGALLDTTMVLYGSGMAYGHSHGNANVPTLVAGGEKLGLRHGRHVDLNAAGRFEGYALDENGRLTSDHYQICSRPVNDDARLSNLLLTLAQRMGVEAETFADSLGTIGEIEA